MHDTMLGRRLLETAGPGRWVPAVTFLAGMVFLVGTALAEVAAGQQATEVKVERVRPEKQSYATLRFLKENRGFIRARFDLLREKPVGRNGGAGEIDPGLLAYSKMLAEVMAAEDSVGAAHNAYRQRLLYTSATELDRLGVQLDLMERLISEQSRRLGIIQENFTGDQKTALMVVLSGYPKEAQLSQVVVTLEDGASVSVPLTAQQIESLKRGGIIQIYHGFLEPRQQVVEVALTGDRWPQGDSGFVTLNPARDRLTFLRLELSGVRPDQGAPGIQASFWLHDAGIPRGEG